jgi:heme exporter protein C
MTENRRLYLLTAISVAAVLGAAGMIFLYAPQDAVEGPVQRLFYVHAPAAIAAYCCFGLVLLGSAGYLWRQSLRGDRLARAGAAVGLVFTTITFAMGMIWAKPMWGWDPSQTWDARLTSTAVLWVVYAGYLMVRRYATPGHPAMRLAAVVGIIGFVDVPVVHFSVQWWRTLHPAPVLTASSGPALPPEMLLTFGVSTVAILLLAGTLVAIRYRIEARRDAREERAVASQLSPTATGAR